MDLSHLFHVENSSAYILMIGSDMANRFAPPCPTLRAPDFGCENDWTRARLGLSSIMPLVMFIPMPSGCGSGSPCHRSIARAVCPGSRWKSLTFGSSGCRTYPRKMRRRRGLNGSRAGVDIIQRNTVAALSISASITTMQRRRLRTCGKPSTALTHGMRTHGAVACLLKG